MSREEGEMTRQQTESAEYKEIKNKLNRIIQHKRKEAIKCLFAKSWLEMQKALRVYALEGEWTNYTEFVMNGGKTPPQKIHKIVLRSKFITKYRKDGRFISCRLYEEAEGKTPQAAIIELRRRMEDDSEPS